MLKTLPFATIFAATLTAYPVNAFQIGTLGAKLESRLTNETESSLLRASGRLGKRLKLPVHEEITQLAFDCPANLASLENDNVCASSDASFANTFIMYGVRWNDLPPFRLAEGQGASCKKWGIFNAPACNVKETIRFATQPDCWLCLFFEAEKTAQSKKIAGCNRAEGMVSGNLMTRSHFGDLQFLHAMADGEGVDPAVTQSKLMGWAEFATIQEHFGCTEWTVSDLYILGRKETMSRHLPDIAFGSSAHTIQDSFASGHAERDPVELGTQCKDMAASQPGRIVEFHAYGLQDGHKHDEQDARDALVVVAQRDANVISTMRQLYLYYYDNAKWSQVAPYFTCLFALSDRARVSSAGAEYARER